MQQPAFFFDIYTFKAIQLQQAEHFYLFCHIFTIIHIEGYQTHFTRGEKWKQFYFILEFIFHPHQN